MVQGRSTRAVDLSCSRVSIKRINPTEGVEKIKSFFSMVGGKRCRRGWRLGSGSPSTTHIFSALSARPLFNRFLGFRFVHLRLLSGRAFGAEASVAGAFAATVYSNKNKRGDIQDGRAGRPAPIGYSALIGEPWFRRSLALPAPSLGVASNAPLERGAFATSLTQLVQRIKRWPPQED